MLLSVPIQAPQSVEVRVLNSTDIQVSFVPPDQQMIPGVNLGYKVGQAGAVVDCPLRNYAVLGSFPFGALVSMAMKRACLPNADGIFVKACGIAAQGPSEP